jgi:hypothetical protein
MTYNEASAPSKVTVRNVPNVYAPPIYPTAQCMGSSAIGGSGAGFGFSIGSSWRDDECGIRETAHSFQKLGLQDDGLAVLCTSKYAAAAPSCKAKPAAVVVPAAVVPAAVAPAAVAPAATEETINAAPLEFPARTPAVEKLGG